MLEATWIGFSPMIGSLLASLLAVYYFAWCRSRFVRLIDALPGPKTYPFLGNILELNVAHDELLRKSSFDWIKQHGSIYRIWFTVRPMVVIASPELLEPILSSHTLATKADEYDCFIPLLGKSILVAKPEEWKKNRRLLNPAFKGQILNSFMDAFHDKSLLCAKEFEEAIESNSGGKINVFPIMTHCTLDIICETAMGGKTLTGEDKASYIKNLHGFENIFLQRLKQPWLRLDWLFKLSGPGRANERFVGGLRDFSNMLIRHRRELVKRKTKLAQNDLSERDVNPTDELQVDDDTKKNLIFMDLLIKEGDLNGNFNSVEMRDEVSLMMAAGHDTLALAFTWFLYLISRHPDKQKLLMEELSIVFGDSDRPCTVDMFYRKALLLPC
ncbi:cytochrome P450 4c3 isoform X4 [Daphnia magna]|uniref:cytochrome P450 4c3 isoform X4 n=1 Tax=Daphnia magna TaxID=35525 RepID=UPI001E1BD6AC|nr:cytochrome P450 4c3 isoform X4 [Daphnia magna]